MAETKTGLLDTSVVIDLGIIAPADLPEEASVSAVTMAELSAGPHATDEPAERARRQDRLQHLESWVEPVPFDGDCARAYGRIYAAVLAAGRQPRRARGRSAHCRDRVGRGHAALHAQCRRLSGPRADPQGRGRLTDQTGRPGRDARLAEPLRAAVPVTRPEGKECG